MGVEVRYWYFFGKCLVKCFNFFIKGVCVLCDLGKLFVVKNKLDVLLCSIKYVFEFL